MIKECQNQPHFTLIQNNEELAQVCQLARQQSAVALDTEFMRISTYYPKLGLIQLYDGERVSLIDPLSITDFSPFVELLRDQQVTKILHACNEDLLVFLQEFDALPQPMMDTQIMARFLGFANSAGLAKLVLHYLGIEMDKGATRTNWLKRPLSPVQLQYAAGDVWYLLPVYQKMQIELAQSPWLQAVIDDCQLAISKTSKLDDRDLSTIFGVSLDQAEELKIRFGSCSMDGVLPGESVRPSLEDVRGTPLCSRSLIVQTLYERAKEFFRIYRDVIEKAGHLDKVHAVIITGGGANLRAIDEVARDVFGVPVRIGAPLCFDEKNALSMRPNASVAAGLLMAADKTRAAGDSRSYRTPSLLNLSGRIRTVFFGDY